MIFSLSLRNITRNKRNSFVMILLIGVITALFFIGNSVMRKADQGLRQTYVDNLTSDIVIQKETDVTMSLFGANTPVIEEFFTIPALPAYEAVLEEIRSTPGVGLVTSQVSGQAVVDCLEERGEGLLCGIDAESYFSLFPGIRVEEGRLLEPGEYGAMITAARAARIEKTTGAYPSPGTPVKFTTAGEFGFRIREVPVVGIFSYKSSVQFVEESLFLVDAQTVRALSSMQVASGNAEVSTEERNLLSTDIESLFGGDAGGDASSEGENGLSVEDLTAMLSSAEEDPLPEDARGGDWNFIIIRLAEGASASEVLDALNARLASYGVLAVDWRTAAGVSALLVLLIQVLFNTGVVLVSVAGILTIVNLLLISVFRRTREIGTLRAIGASDGYIRALILGENLALSFAAGLLGVVAGVIVMYVVNGMNIVIGNELIASLLGGRILTMVFLPEVAFTAFLVAVLVGVFASLYPVQKAVKIEPIVAVRRG